MARITARPNGAYKFLVTVLYDRSSRVESLVSGALLVPSIRGVARLLGTESKRVNGWLVWLEDRGYIEALSWSPDRRAAQFRVRRPSRI